ncbi:MAG: hypothetical protein J7K40_00250 [candidate division Zixibacteria bacterium]|nr:hypothetical protein [candidate division Zixibacteria bacterium]
MCKAPRLEDKIRMEIQHWFSNNGYSFILVIKEFCQGNRRSLSQVMVMVEELAAKVFVGEGKSVNNELLEDLEYGIFDLIGQFSSTPGGDALENAIRNNIIDNLTTIFAETKKQWNLNNYKITASYEELDPKYDLIPANETISETEADCDADYLRKCARNQAKEILDELVVFAKANFRGEMKRKIAINWLENPDKRKDFRWLASMTGTSIGSAKVILTRIKQSVAKNYNLKKTSNKLVLLRSD